MTLTLEKPVTNQDLGDRKLISLGREIVIRPTNGQRTIAKAVNIFKAGIDSNFVKYKANKEDQPTKRTKVQVFEQTHDGMISDIFCFGKDFDHLCLSQDQIISFVEEHGEWIAEKSSWGTFFLFKTKNSYSVAAVNRNADGHYVYMFRLNEGRDTYAKRGHYIVVPNVPCSRRP